MSIGTPSADLFLNEFMLPSEKQKDPHELKKPKKEKTFIYDYD